MNTPKLRVLLAHNAYQQRGGEDAVVEAELALLREHGHDVLEYTRHNDGVKGMSRATLAAQTLWSGTTVDEVLKLLQTQRPDVIHVHNTFPLISPSLYWAAARMEVPVVQTLHNFRLLCPQAMFLREGRVCEDCLGHVPWRAVAHKCYRGSAVQSAVLATTVSVHRALGSFRNKVTRYIALNTFCRDKFVAGGLPAERLRIKPNFLDSPMAPEWVERAGGLFVGRLSYEKGVDVLANAVAQMPGCAMSVIGGGDMEALARQAFGAGYLGFRPLDEILALMRQASYLVVPSICYDSFPRTIVEAFASGLPVIASRLGSLPEIVHEGRTGLLFEPGNAQDLASKLAWAEAHPDEMIRMGQAARADYEARYTSGRNYEILMDIYDDAVRALAAEH